MEPGVSIKARPSEIITSLRRKAELKKNAYRKTSATVAAIRVGQNARYCPAGHCFTKTLLENRQRYIQQMQGTLPHTHPLPTIFCSGCSQEIREPYVAGSCKICELDFCTECYESGTPIDELLQEAEEARDSVIMSQMSFQSYGSLRMNPTTEYCAAGHQLCCVSVNERKRYLQEVNGLAAPPTIECDCCSRVITKENVAGCCFECDIDFCKNCFQTGQSFEDILEIRSGPPQDDDIENRPSTGERYNGRRPTYKGSGRISYDNYPDPAAYRWSFTGSSETNCVEFFEKDYGKTGVIQLDFYYTKGTVRTVLKHPKKGKKQLYSGGKKIGPTLYKKILMDPRTHIDRRRSSSSTPTSRHHPQKKKQHILV